MAVAPHIGRRLILAFLPAWVQVRVQPAQQPEPRRDDLTRCKNAKLGDEQLGDSLQLCLLHILMDGFGHFLQFLCARRCFYSTC